MELGLAVFIRFVLETLTGTFKFERGKEDVFGEGENSVVSDISRLTKGLLQFPLEVSGRIEQINLGIFIGRRHLRPG